MLERQLVQARGSKALTLEDGTPAFQFQIKNPNYRGVPASLIDGIDIELNGKKYAHDAASWTLGGQTLSLAQLQESETLRWPLDELATITLPVDAPLEAGVQDLSVCVYIRRPYIPGPFCRSPFRAKAKPVVIGESKNTDMPLSVSTYSYTGDMYTLITLEDFMADAADMGATGIEMLAEANLPGYPDVSAEWKATWFALLEKYQLTPTNLGTWIDTARWHSRDLTVEEGAAQLEQDLKLAAELGFTSIRPKFGVTSLELDPHPIWQEAVLRALPLAEELNVIICPEIHSPTPIKHKVTQDYIAFIKKHNTTYFKLMIDTGIFQTAPCDDGHEGIEVKGGKRPPFLEPLAVPMADFAEIMEHVYFIQTKFFEIDDNLHDLHIPWDNIVATLKACGWKGWLSSEYEGRREPYRGRDQVRRQHALLNKLL